jgi:hypothetical protein
MSEERPDLAAVLPYRRGTVQERLERRLVRMPNGCLEWTGYRQPGGYGRINVRGHQELVHRVAWGLANCRPVPDGMFILHSCDNPPCCEPTHLRPGSHTDNMTERQARGRCNAGIRNTEKTHCSRGHEFSEANTYLHDGSRYCRPCHALTEFARRELIGNVPRP